MDWQLAIERNREALKRILAMLVAMAGLTGAGDQRAAPTLPRHLHRLVLRLLRPAEAAARRLIIVAARGLVVEPPAPRNRPRRKPKPALTRKNGFGTGIVIRPGPLPEWARALAPKRSVRRSLPLLDPLKRFGTRRRTVRPSAMPHIRSFDDMRAPLFHQPAQTNPPPPTPDDPLDAGRLSRRIEALALALDDLPRQATRLARWQARRDAAIARDAAEAEAANLPPCGGDVRQDRGGQRRAPTNEARATTARQGRARFSPMRPGRPPGWRRRTDHPVYDILNELHGLAAWATACPDTS